MASSVAMHCANCEPTVGYARPVANTSGRGQASLDPGASALDASAVVDPSAAGAAALRSRNSDSGDRSCGLGVPVLASLPAGRLLDESGRASTATTAAAASRSTAATLLWATMVGNCEAGRPRPAEPDADDATADAAPALLEDDEDGDDGAAAAAAAGKCDSSCEGSSHPPPPADTGRNVRSAMKADAAATIDGGKRSNEYSSRDRSLMYCAMHLTADSGDGGEEEEEEDEPLELLPLLLAAPAVASPAPAPVLAAADVFPHRASMIFSKRVMNV